MTVIEFIKKYFIEEIGSLVDERPFVSFVLMAIGVEFLGKCLNNNPWDDWKIKSPGDTFRDATKTYATLNKYDVIPDLYHSLRCRLAHRLMVKGYIILSPTFGVHFNYTIGCKEFYDDFKQACQDAIDNKNGMIKKNLSEEYNIEVSGMTGSTSTTPTIIFN